MSAKNALIMRASRVDRQMVWRPLLLFTPESLCTVSIRILSPAWPAWPAVDMDAK